MFNHENAADGKEQLRLPNESLKSKFVNDEQYTALKEKIEDEGLDLDEVIWQLKQVKVGCGFVFLPRMTCDLLSKVKDGVAIFAEEKTSQLRDKLLAMLDELLQRKAISKGDHQDHIERYNLD